MEQKKSSKERLFKLKAIGGIAPQRYLFLLFSLFVVGALTLATLLFINRAYTITIYTEPRFAEAHIVQRDGNAQFRGTTPLRVRIKPGAYTAHITKDGFTPTQQQLRFKKRLFTSSAWRQRDTIFAALSVKNEDDLYGALSHAIARWSHSGISHTAYQKPPQISIAVDSLYASGQRQFAQQILMRAMRDVGDQEFLADWIRAQQHYYNGSAQLTLPHTVTAAITQSIAALHRQPNSVILVENILAQSEALNNAAIVLAESDWAAALFNQQPHVESINDAQVQIEVIVDTPFITLPVGSLAVANGEIAFKHAAHVAAQTVINQHAQIRLAAHAVTNRQYAAFIAHNPQWAPHNSDTLRATERIDDSYLYAFDLQNAPAQPLSYISWHAARAYCTWLTEQLPAEFAAYEVRLPHRYEIAHLAQYLNDREISFTQLVMQHLPSSGASISTAAPQSDGSAQFWEWTESSFAISAPYFAPLSERALSSDARVRTVMQSIHTESAEEILIIRGALPTQSAAPSLGFRPLLVRIVDE